MLPDLTGFQCRCCGACCRIPGGIVRLTDEDIARIADFLGMSQQQFIDGETSVSPDRKCLVIKDGPDGFCSMLDEKGLCRIHPVKPHQCKTFPYEWTNPDSARDCPGIASLMNM